MNLEIYFTKEEMCEFLKKEGYTIETIKTWKSYNTYHNNVGETLHNVEIAYVGKFDVFNRVDGAYRDLSVENYKVEKVFKDVLKKKLLNL
jgi:hypothetical protein